MKQAITYAAAAALAAALCTGGCTKKTGTYKPAEKQAVQKQEQEQKQAPGKSAPKMIAESLPGDAHLGTLPQEICDLQNMPDILFSNEMITFMSAAMGGDSAQTPEQRQAALDAAKEEMATQRESIRAEIKGKVFDPCKSQGREVKCGDLYKEISDGFETDLKVVETTASYMGIEKCGILTMDALIKGEPGEVKDRFFAGRINGRWKVITFIGPEKK